MKSGDGGDGSEVRVGLDQEHLHIRRSRHDSIVRA
jgi:hypothetical protein